MRTGPGSGTSGSVRDRSAGRVAMPPAPSRMEARFQAVFEGSRDAIGVSKAGVHVLVNPAYRALFGFPPEADLAGAPILDLIAPECRAQVMEFVARRARGESVPAVYETRGLRVDGTKFDMEVNVSLYREGEEELTLVILRNITERKMAEQEIAERGATLQQIMDTASVAIFLVDKSGRITHANHRMAEMFGCEMKDLVGSEYVSLVHPSEREMGRGKMLALLASEIPSVDHERHYWRRDGTEFWGHLAGRRYHDVLGNEIGLIGVITDIDKRKRAEDALRESEILTRSIIESIPVGMHMYHLEPDGRLVFIGANPAADNILGVDNSVFIGKTIEDAFPPLKETEVPQRYRDAAASGKAWSTESIEYHEGVIKGAFEVHAFQTVPNTMVAAFEEITARKRSELALRESEEKFSMIFKQAPLLITLSELDIGRYLDVNEKFLQISGFTRDEVIGKTAIEIGWISEGQRALLHRAVREQGHVVGMELSLRRKDGRSVDCLYHGEMIMVNGKPRLLSIAQDMSERKRAEARIKESEKKYRTLFESSADGIFILDLDGNFIDANPIAYQRLGYTREEMLSMNISMLDTPEYADKVPGRVRQLREQGVAVFESANRRKDGSVMQIEVSARLLEYEGKPVLFSVNRDITERKRVEEELREKENKYRTLFESANDGIFIQDSAGFRDCNQRGAEMYGLPKEKIIGRLPDEFAPERQPDGRLSAVVAGEKVQAALSGEPQVFEWHPLRADGTPFDVEITLNRIELSGSVCLQAIVRDITERKQLEQERLKFQKLESLGTLAGGIAHDFNNLLQGIFGYISMAKLTIDQREKSLAMLEQAEKALHQSVNLTSQLLTFSKGGKPVRKVIDLRTVIENAVTFALSGSRVSYDLSCGDDLCAVEADEGQIGQVVQNIVLNAEQSMPLGGRIDISARNVPAARAGGLSLTAPDGLVEIVVSDRGMGIPPEHLPRIFDPYFTTKEKGSGLGLATSYSIVKNHDGMIDVSSVLGKGSTFTVYLPATHAAPEQTALSASVMRIKGRKLRILVMDDEQIVRVVTGELLRELGHEAEFAEHGDAAVEKYRRAKAEGRPFDAVILDLTIRGGMGGLETLRKLKEIDPEVKAVVSSGYSDDSGAAEYTAHGFRSYLKKPYNMEYLQDVLNRLME